VASGGYIVRRYVMELWVSVLGLAVSIVGVYFGYVSYKRAKNTDC
jgi:hypothetical protein